MFSRFSAQRSKPSTSSLEGALKRLSTSKQRADSEVTFDVVGSLGLNLLFQPSEPLIDFVFVHGLGGGSRKTWSFSEDLSHYWPQEWLPQDPSFKNVRIHSFGYASKWAQTGRSALNIHDFAKSLVAAIQDSPLMGKGQQTPLVLIGHSMGGLVIKNAYMIAREDPLYKALAERIHTMVFLGTPHRGSAIARVLNYTLKSVLVPFGSKAYVDDLNQDSVMLQLINDGFRHVAGDLQLRSFYEVIETRIGPISSLIVNRESAVLGYPNEHSALINANHRGICKFQSPSDPNYVTVRNALASIAVDIESDLRHQTREIQQNQLRGLQQYLRVKERPEDDLAAYMEQQVEGSCVWLTSSDTFCDWRDGKIPSKEVFWVNGQPGAGKSFIAAHVVNSLQDLNMDTAYFFIRHSDKSSSALESCLCSLAFQMALMSFDIREAILAMQDNEIQISQDEPRALWRKLFVNSILRTSSQRTQYWVIDGLDECSNPGALFPLLANLKSAFPLRILITSRITPAIQKGFLQLRRVTVESASPEQTLDDVKLFVKKRVEELDIDLDEYRLKITSTIIEKSEGCFLWVFLVMEELEAAFSKSEIDLILNEVPVGMDPLYKRILEGMSQMSRGKAAVKAVLMWTTCATRALTLEELEAALRIHTKDEAIVTLEKFIMTSCGNLVYVDLHKKIRLIHQTAKEFLLRQDLDSEFVISCRDTHSVLADTCLQYLLCDEMKVPRNRKVIMPLGKRIKTRSPFADYACTSFSDHIREADTTRDNLMIMLDKFLQSNVLSWIEAVAVKGTTRPLVLTAKNLRDVLESRKRRTGSVGNQFQLIINWSSDLGHIATKFGRNLLELPTAIYLLIPSFCPLESSIKAQFGSSQGSIMVSGLSETAWNDRLASQTYGGVGPVSTSCSDEYFAVGLSSGDIHLYSAETCERAMVLKHVGRRDPVELMAFDTSGDLFVCAGRGSIRLWNTTNGTEVWSSELSIRLVAVLFLASDAVLISISNENTVTTHDVATGRIISSISRQNPFETQPSQFQRTIQHATFSVEHNLVAVVYRALPIAIYAMDDNSFLGSCARVEGAKKRQGDIAALSMIFNPDPDLNLIVARYYGGDLVLYDTVTFEVVKLVNGVNATSLAANPNGRILATGMDDGIIQLYGFETLKLVYRIMTADSSVRSMSFSMDGLRLLDVRAISSSIWEPSVLTRANATQLESLSDIYLVDPNNGGDKELPKKGNIKAIAIHTKENVILCGIDDGSVVIYDSTTGSRIKTLCRHEVGVSIRHIEVGNKLDILVTGDTAGRVLVRKLFKSNDRLECQEPYLEHQFRTGISQLLLNSSEDRLLICINEQSILWDLVEDRIIQDSCMPRRETKIWSHDAENPTQLIAVSRFPPHKLNKHLWSDLSELSSSDITDLRRSEEPKNIYTGIPGRVIIEAWIINAKQSRRAIILNSTSSLTEHTNSTLIPQSFSDLAFRRTLGTYHTRLLFLDKEGWICSIDLSADQSKPAKQGASAAELATDDTGKKTYIIRHFFLPDDWLSRNSEIMIRVLPNSNCMFVIGNEIAVISNAI